MIDGLKLYVILLKISLVLEKYYRLVSIVSIIEEEFCLVEKVIIYRGRIFRC